MPETIPVVDTNISLGQWPMRRVACDEQSALVAKLKTGGVVEAWAGSFDGLFHSDLTGVNDRLAEACNAETLIHLRPFGEINPIAANWEEEVRRCADVHKMNGVRLHPNYHGYPLDHPNFARLLQLAKERNLVVQLTALMEDSRMMHPFLRVPPVDLQPLDKVLAQVAGVKLVLLNALTTAIRPDVLSRVLQAGEVYVEIAMLEGVAGIENCLKTIPLERLLFGSHSPSFYFESAGLKVKESALPAGHVRAISYENARKLIPQT